ncbi:nucleic acid-binding protein [Streptomyces youssoufiensis]
MTFDYPADLRALQKDLFETRARLQDLLKTLPYSVEPITSWRRPEGYWLPSARPYPDSPGWSEQDQKEVTALRERERDLAEAILVHPFWTELDASDRPKARSHLKHAVDHANDES